MSNQLQSIESFLQEQIVPIANKIDYHPESLSKALQQMGDRSWLALKVAPELGGAGLSEADYRCWQISMARVSGALTFLQTQHQSAVVKIAQSDNRILQQEFLPHAATGNVLIGVGFSHLRRRGAPVMTAKETKAGYILTGEVPWITGYDFFDHFVIGATLADGRELYGLLPLKNQSHNGGEIILSPPMELLAMTATNTVSAKIDRWFLERDRLLTINPAGAIHQSSRRNILNHGFFALGCAYGGLDILSTIAQKKQLDFLQESWQSLNTEAKQHQKRAIASVLDDRATYQQQLQLRAQTIDLAQRCSMAAVIASSGAANYLNSRAGRVYREALLFSVSGQTTDVMEASLKKLLPK